MVARGTGEDVLEVKRRGGDLSVDAAMRTARLGGVRDRTSSPALASWRWSAFQLLMYGSECYLRVLSQLPSYLDWKLVESCVTRMQRAYRNRLLFRFMRVSRGVIETRRAREAAKRKERLEWAARIVQRIYRGKAARDALREVMAAARENDAASKEEKMAAMRDKAEEREARKMQDSAARIIQRLVVRIVARRRVVRKRKERNEECAMAAMALSQNVHVRVLGAVLARHRITRGVLREVYEQVCLGYELESMVRQTAEVRQTEWHKQLQVSLNEATTVQLGLEPKIVALAAASNAPPSDSGSGPVDVVGLVAGLTAELDAYTDRVIKLEAEARAWEARRDASVVEPTTSVVVKQLKQPAMDRVVAQQSLLKTAEANRKQSLAESSAASGKPPSWQHAPKLLSERKTPLSASQAEILLEGGEAAMRKASEWGTPGTLGQGSVVSAIATTAAEASASERAQVSALASTRSELAAAEGELSVIRELIKLHDGLIERNERLRLCAAELSDCGPSVQLSRLSTKLPSAELEEELTPGLPEPPQITQSKSATEWDKWLKAAEGMHQAAMERLCRGEAGREAVALEELHEARKGRDAARKRVEAAEALLREWLLAEGAKRVYASAQGKERRRLRREMLGRRCGVFRRMFSLPIAARLEAKRATRELTLAEAASQLAATVDADPVQARHYTEGEMRVTCLNTSTTALTELYYDLMSWIQRRGVCRQQGAQWTQERR